MGTEVAVGICNLELEARNPELEFMGPREIWCGTVATEGNRTDFNH